MRRHCLRNEKHYYGLGEGNRFFGHILIDIRVLDVLRDIPDGKSHSTPEHSSLSKPQSTDKEDTLVKCGLTTIPNSIQTLLWLSKLKNELFKIFLETQDFKLPKIISKWIGLCKLSPYPNLHSHVPITRWCLWPNRGAGRSNFFSGKILTFQLVKCPKMPHEIKSEWQKSYRTRNGSIPPTFICLNAKIKKTWNTHIERFASSNCPSEMELPEENKLPFAAQKN